MRKLLRGLPGSVPSPSNVSCFLLLPETTIFTRLENRRKHGKLQAAKRGQLLQNEAWDPKMQQNFPWLMAQPTGNVTASFGKKPLITGDYCREGGQVGGHGRAFLYVPLWSRYEEGDGESPVTSHCHPPRSPAVPSLGLRWFCLAPAQLWRPQSFWLFHSFIS